MTISWSRYWLYVAGTLTFLLLCAATTVMAADRALYDSTITALQQEDYAAARDMITRIHEADSTDPDYFVLSFNYYYMKADRGGVVIRQSEPTEDSALVLTDTAGTVVGFMQDTSMFNLDTLARGTAMIAQGIARYPDRLDMRFGLVHACEQAELYDAMTEALLGILRRRAENNDAWRWIHNQPLPEEPRSFVLENVQSRVRMLWDRNTEATDSLLVTLAKALCEYYPESVYGYSDLGSFYASHQQYEESLSWYQKAAAIDSTDVLIMANLATVFINMGDKDKARAMLRHIMEVGAPDEQEFARRKLETLK